MMYPITVVLGGVEGRKRYERYKSDIKDLGSRIGTPPSSVEFQMQSNQCSNWNLYRDSMGNTVRKTLTVLFRGLLK
jgi:hypothetical protein